MVNKSVICKIIFYVLLCCVHLYSYSEDECYSYMSHEDVRQILELAMLQDFMVDNNHKIKIGSDISRKKIPDGLYHELCIKAVYTKPQSNQYRIYVNFVNNKDNHEPQLIEFKGRYIHNVTVLAFNKVINKGDVIRKSDIDIIDIPYRKLPYGTVNNIEEIVGMTVKQKSHIYSPIAYTHLMQPELVKKNDILRIKYDRDNLSIETKAVALEGGAQGETIRIRNIKSNKTIMGTVVDHATVDVGG